MIGNHLRTDSVAAEIWEKEGDMVTIVLATNWRSKLRAVKTRGLPDRLLKFMLALKSDPHFLCATPADL